MGSVHRKSAPLLSKKPLYDQFLGTLPREDEPPSTLGLDKALSYCKKASQSSSSEPSKETVGESTEGSEHSKESTKSSDIGDQSSNAGAETEKSFTPEEIEAFLRKIYEPVDSSKVYGFDYDKMTLKMLLLDGKGHDSLKLVGVVGMVGVGKTALARSIFDEEEVKQRFVPRIQIALSESEEPKPKSMEMVVRRMLKLLGVEEEIINSISNVDKLPGLLYALHLQLKGKRYLILLDDVREEDEYYGKLESCLRNGHGFPTGHGGAVIVTSRKEESVTKMVDKQNLHLHRLVPISDSESCWPIYQNMALADVKPQDTSSSDTPKEVKDELKNKCGGLPLAARIMGELKRQELERSSIKDDSSIVSGEAEGSKDVDSPETGDGSKEASATSKVGSTNQEKSHVSGDGPKETWTPSKDGPNNQASVISEDGPKELASTASKDVVSGEGPEEESAVSKDEPSQVSTASGSTKPDLQHETNQNQA
ncbi:Disease resistance protein [Corchorus olitorius]|uniref:Disease resistance protein n=1 Tax=Corchorus olitorius TaxID=93759 RepID=A0A1R3JF46_9ROSI|nr:Disease resistance protein [Corchorus olitorius]